MIDPNAGGCVCDKCGPPWRDDIPQPAPGPEMSLSDFTWWSWMRVCPTCGNKRCPGAADHENPCSGSNEPGQPGSLYA